MNLDNVTQSACYKYDVTANTWTSISSLPVGKDRFATALSGDVILAIGGYNTEVKKLTVYKYSISGNSWISAASLPFEIGWGKAVGYNDNYIYLAAGSTRRDEATAHV